MIPAPQPRGIPQSLIPVLLRDQEEKTRSQQCVCSAGILVNTKAGHVSGTGEPRSVNQRREFERWRRPMRWALRCGSAATARHGDLRDLVGIAVQDAVLRSRSRCSRIGAQLAVNDEKWRDVGGISAAAIPASAPRGHPSLTRRPVPSDGRATVRPDRSSATEPRGASALSSEARPSGPPSPTPERSSPRRRRRWQAGWWSCRPWRARQSD